MSKKTILNTELAVKVAPEYGLLVAISPGGIEAQEKVGQEELVRSEEIPTNCNLSDEQLLELGFTELEDPSSEDPLFRGVTYPQGWTKKASDHSMHTDVLDEKGRKRANIFYKAAFYDRSARIHFKPRYSYGRDWDRSTDTLEICSVKDGDTCIFSCQEENSPRPNSAKEEQDWFRTKDQVETRLKALCRDFLVTLGIMDFENPLLYWDLP